MRKLSFLALAVAGLLLAACSSDKDAASSSSIVETDNVDRYIALSIDLPTTSVAAMRATDDNGYGNENFDLDDGLNSEYFVQNATLMLFRPVGTDENDATFVAAYNLNPEGATFPTDPQVTVTAAKVVKKVGGAVQAGDLALVILNKNSIVDFTNDGGAIKVMGTSITAGSTTFKDVKESIVTAASLGATEMTTNSFFMANAPLSDKQGSTAVAPTGAVVRTLVPIQVYETETAAQAADPAHIYVERGVAKVTLQPLTSFNLGTQAQFDPANPGTKTPLSVTLQSWTIDQTNKVSYMIRSTEDHASFVPLLNKVKNIYRYIGGTDITEGTPGEYKYRTYFAKDPNYTGALDPATYMNYAATANYTALVGNEHPQYCFENTFDVDNQTVKNTTLARLKVKVGDGTDLYVVNGNRGNILNADGVKDLVYKAAKTAIDYQVSLGIITISSPIAETDFTITVPNAAGKVTPTIVFTAAGSAKITSGTFSATDLQESVDKVITEVLCYKGGESYYTIRIKHFGDDLTPWHTGNAAETPAPEIGNIYPAGTDRDNNYLGRYGVLRNNWYDLKVNSIKYLGEPTPEDYSENDTPDDELDAYISVQIHILSWAKRIQSWDL